MRFSLNKKTREKIDQFHNEAISAKVAVNAAAICFRDADLRGIDPRALEGIKTIIEEDERMRRSEKRSNHKTSGDD